MMNFFQKFFKKEEEQSDDDMETLQAKVEEYERNSDFVKLSELYFKLGKSYYDMGDKEHAMLYLGRSSTLFNNMDEVFNSVDESMIDQCSEWLGKLEEENLFANQVLDEVEEKAEELGEKQKALWGLLSLSRFQNLFSRLSWMPDGEFLTHIDEVVAILFESLYGTVDKKSLKFVMDFENQLYEYNDSGQFADANNYIPVTGGIDFQLFDLNGMNVMTELYLLLDKFPDLLPQEEGFEEGAQVDFIPCTLLIDYYLRSQKKDIRELPPIKDELARIFSDYDFVKTHPEKEEVARRLQTYKRLDLLKRI